MTIKDLKAIVCEQNKRLPSLGLVILTEGNVSQISQDRKYIVIKPSGVDYSNLTPDKMVVVDMKGKVVEGKLKPSVDTPTHLEIYRQFPNIGGITHTHSPFATAFAQMKKPIPCYGTTHADAFPGEIPVTREMTKKEIDKNMELNTGKVIAETLKKTISNCVLVAGHGVFTFDVDARRAVNNSSIAEKVAMLAFSGANTPEVNNPLMQKHFNRKHAENKSYYGQTDTFKSILTSDLSVNRLNNKSIRIKDKFNFDDLFIFEMANNHQGSLKHGLDIVREHGAVAKKHGIRAAVKFQFRNHDTYIHPDYKNSSERLIRRFLDNQLSKKEFKTLADEVRKQGLLTMSTPWDEDSVDMISELDIDIIKIASCSAKDWPLLYKAVKAGKPMVVSTGSLSIADIDKLVSFLQHRYINFAIMHCVAIYPTLYDKLQLNQIKILANRYPGVPIGFSTHEDPDNTEAIQIAYTNGARLFERHINFPGKNININKYSSTPKQIDKWISAYERAVASAGMEDKDLSVQKEEEGYLREITRGTFLKRPVKKGEPVTSKDVFFAIPIQEGQLTSGEFRDGVLADRDYKKNEPFSDVVKSDAPSRRDIIYHSIHAIRGMLNEAKVPVHHEYVVKLYHHYGLEEFYSTGAVIIDCVNREYCKKIVVQLPGQSYPYHHHTKKEETFHVIAGKLEMEVEGRHKTLYPGDTQLIQRGVKHSFWTDEGVIFEELSTTYVSGDSLYEDQAVNQIPHNERTTELTNWGFHQFDGQDL